MAQAFVGQKRAFTDFTLALAERGFFGLLAHAKIGAEKGGLL